MAKKVNIIGIATKDGSNFVVGEEAVERIIYEKHGYNKGHQGDFPSYVIFFAGRNTRVIVPKYQLSTMTAEVVEEDQAEILPELPE